MLLAPEGAFVVGAHIALGGAGALAGPVSDFRPGPLGPEMDEGVQGASTGGSVPAGTRARLPPAQQVLPRCAPAPRVVQGVLRWRPGELP